MKKYLLLLLMIFGLVGCDTTAQKKEIKSYPFDNSYKAYAEVLNQYVVGLRFDYSMLKKNRENIDKFVGELAGLTEEQYGNMTTNEKKAMWINAYNGITLLSIINNYPLKSIKDIDGVWDKTKWTVAGREVTLDEIEHKILRVEFTDPRIHFSINCASLGCPPLLNKPFLPETLEQQLDEVARNFVNLPTRNDIDYGNHKITTTEILQWFGDDFIKNYGTEEFDYLNPKERAVLNFMFTFIDKSDIDRSAKWQLDYFPYDWALNDTNR